MKGPFDETMGGPFKFMVVVLYQLPYNALGLKGDFSHAITVVAVNQQTDKVYNGRKQRTGFKGPQPGDFDQALDKGEIETSSYFDIDLIDDLKLPIAPATYTVYATLGEYKSNVLTIKTMVK